MADLGTHSSAVLTDTSGEDEKVDATQSSSISPYILLDAIGMHRESQAVTLRAFFCGLCDVTHIRTLRADTSDTTLLRQQEGQVFQIEVGLTWGSLLEEGSEELRIVVLLIHQVLDDTAVDVTSTSTHHKAFAGGQAH